MAATNKALVEGGLLTNAAAVVYTSPAIGTGTRITAFTATNTTGSAVTYSVYIVPDGDVAGFANLLLDDEALAGGEADVPAALINQLIPPSSTLEAFASSGATVAVSASGIEFT